MNLRSTNLATTENTATRAHLIRYVPWIFMSLSLLSCPSRQCFLQRVFLRCITTSQPRHSGGRILRQLFINFKIRKYASIKEEVLPALSHVENLADPSSSIWVLKCFRFISVQKVIYEKGNHEKLRRLRSWSHWLCHPDAWSSHSSRLQC